MNEHFGCSESFIRLRADGRGGDGAGGAHLADRPRPASLRGVRATHQQVSHLLKHTLDLTKERRVKQRCYCTGWF